MATTNRNLSVQDASTQRFPCPVTVCDLTYRETSRLKAHLKSTAHAYGCTFCYRCLRKFDNPLDLAIHQLDQPCSLKAAPPGKITAMQVAQLDSIEKGIGEMEIYRRITIILSSRQSSGYASRDESTPSQSLPENPRLSESPSKSADIDSAINMSPPAPNSNTMVPNGASAAPATPEADRPGPDLEMSDTINPLILGRRLSELLGDEDIGAQATQSVWADRTPIEDGLMGPHHTDYNPLEDGFMTANHTDYNPLEDGFMAPHHTDYNPFEDGHVWPDYIIPPD